MSGEEKYANYMLYATGDSVPNVVSEINKRHDFKVDHCVEFKIFTAPVRPASTDKLVFIVARMRRLVVG